LPRIDGETPAGSRYAPHDFVRDILGDIPRPSFGRVEGHDPHRIVELSRQQIVDDGFEGGTGLAGLAIGGAGRMLAALARRLMLLLLSTPAFAPIGGSSSRRDSAVA